MPIRFKRLDFVFCLALLLAAISVAISLPSHPEPVCDWIKLSEIPRDERTLQIGESLRQKIDEDLATSKCGGGVLSRSFFAKNRPKAEFDGFPPPT